MKINVYDFDKTIYNGDVSVDFWLFSVKKHPYLIFLLPLQATVVILMKLKLLSRKTTKEIFFLYLKFIKELNLSEFWEDHKSKIKTWYLKQKQPTDLIITASPEFIITPIAKQLKFNLIGTKMSTKTGKISGENCRGEEKVCRFKSEYKNTVINEFYSDSLSDQPLKNIADKAFLIDGEKIKNWN